MSSGMLRRDISCRFIIIIIIIIISFGRNVNDLEEFDSSLHHRWSLGGVAVRKAKCSPTESRSRLVVVVVVIIFFNDNFVNCKVILILAIEICKIKYNISLNDMRT